MATPPTGATLIPGPSGLKGLTKDQIWKDPDSPKIYRLSASAVSEKPPGDISGTLPPATQAPGSLFDFHATLQEALNEATAARKSSLMTGLQPYMAGLPNSALSEVIARVKGGAEASAEGMYNTYLKTETQQQELETQRRTQTLNLLSTWAKDGTLGDMPDMALLTMGQAAGLSEGQALAWKARVGAINKGDKEKQALELQKLAADIKLTESATAENMAQAAKARTGGDGGTENNAIQFYVQDFKASGLPFVDWISSVNLDTKTKNAIATALYKEKSTTGVTQFSPIGAVDSDTGLTITADNIEYIKQQKVAELSELSKQLAKMPPAQQEFSIAKQRMAEIEEDLKLLAREPSTNGGSRTLR